MTGLFGGKLSCEEHLSGLFAGGGVHVEVAEEHLGVTRSRSAVLGIVIGLDVDGRGDRSLGRADGGRLAVSGGDTVALALGGADDELEVGDALGDGRQGEGHR